MNNKRKRTLALCLALALLFAAFPAVYSSAATSYGKGGTKTESKNQSDLSNARKGDFVYFGSYEQNDKDDGTEPIKWKVIDRDDDYLLLFSVYTLDYQRYHEIQDRTTWADSDIRQWLNEDFFEEAFSEEEREKIVPVTNENDDYRGGEDTDDLVFLLSISQIQCLGSAKSMITSPTTYAANKGAAHNRNGNGWYWLRTATAKAKASFVAGVGGFDVKGYPITYGGGIRPAIWVDRSLFK